MRTELLPITTSKEWRRMTPLVIYRWQQCTVDQDVVILSSRILHSGRNRSYWGMNKIVDILQKDIRLNYIFFNVASSSSPGVLGFSMEKCRKLTFSGKLLGCPLKILVQSPQSPNGGKNLFKMAAIAAGYLLLYPKIMRFFNICHRKAILVCIPLFWNTRNTMKSLFQY